MSDSEKNSFIQYLVAESRKKDQQIACLQKTIDVQGDRLSSVQLTLESMQRDACSANGQLNARLGKLQSDLCTKAQALETALREVDKYRSLYEVLRDEK